MLDVLKLDREQLAYARAVALIELHLEPNCPDCGAGAKRPRCAEERMPGTCPRGKALGPFEKVIHKLERLGDLRELSLWRQRVPLADLYEFSEAEKALLLDLRDAGGEISARRFDDRYTSLGCGSSGKEAVLQGSVGGKCYTRLTDRGKALIETFEEVSA